MKRVVLLGSTGSIGTQTLDVIARFPERLEVAGLAAGGNVELLLEQTKQFRPGVVSVGREEDAERLRAAVADPDIRIGHRAGRRPGLPDGHDTRRLALRGLRPHRHGLPRLAAIPLSSP